MHRPGDDEALPAVQRGINGKTTLLNVRQQVDEVTLDRKQTLMLAKRIDKRGIRMIQRGQRRWRLVIQPGVVIHKAVNDGWQCVHESHLGFEHRSVVA